MLHYFASPYTLLTGIVIGLLFGFLLQKGSVSQANVIISQFLFKNFTMLKVMVTALVVGSLSLQIAFSLGLIETIFMPHSSLVTVIVGGIILGVGLATAGYCPGTSFVAAGQGSKDAWFAIGGLFLGAGLYAELYPWLKKIVLKSHSADTSTIYNLLTISPWILIALFSIGTIFFFYYLEKKAL